MDDYKAILLNDKYRMYIDSAKKAYKNGLYSIAKQNYNLAISTLLELAKCSSDSLKKARLEKAKQIKILVEQIDNGDNIKEKHMDERNKVKDDEDKSWFINEIPNVSFSDIAGLDDVKETINIRIINAFKYPEKYSAYGKKIGGGVLLYGPPGTGKTMIAKAVANETKAKFFVVKGSDLLSKWVGESEKNIHQLFSQVRKQKFSVVFLDEIDSLMLSRGQDVHSDKMINEFLQQIDGFSSENSNVLLLGATNRPWDIDDAIMRSGRFSEKIYVPLPDYKAREFLFKKEISKTLAEKDIDINRLVCLTEGYSCADIAEICDRAKIEPLMESLNQENNVYLSEEHYIKAIKSVKPTVSVEAIKRYEKYNKAGK